MRREADQARLAPADVARVGDELAIQHVEAGGLSGAVGADDGNHLASGDVEGHVAYRLHAAVRLRELLYRENHLLKAPPTPAGKARTRTRITSPMAARQ